MRLWLIALLSLSTPRMSTEALEIVSQQPRGLHMSTGRLIRSHSAAAEKLAAGLAEFEIYIRNNREFIPNFGERYRQGETITTAFVESTINQVVSRRFAKKQQMQWTLKGAHLLLQSRTKVLNNELEAVFRRWYPQFRVDEKAAA